MHRLMKKEQLLTIPNLLSVVRLLLIPLIVWLYCARQEYELTGYALPASLIGQWGDLRCRRSSGAAISRISGRSCRGMAGSWTGSTALC